MFHGVIRKIRGAFFKSLYKSIFSRSYSCTLNVMCFACNRINRIFHSWRNMYVDYAPMFLITSVRKVVRSVMFVCVSAR